MSTFLATAACARLPADALPRLGRWRHRPDVRVVRAADRLWVFWPAGDEAVAGHLLALPEAALLERRGGAWLGRGEHLPAFDVPDPGRAVALDRLLAPEPLTRRPAAPRPPAPLTVRLVRDHAPRRATALRVRLGALAAWAEAAPADDLEAAEAALADDEALLRGRLPPLPGERFWGRRLLIEAGWRPEPALAEGVLAEALGLGEECAVWAPGGVEVVPAAAFGPLSRAGVRLAVGRKGGGR